MTACSMPTFVPRMHELKSWPEFFSQYFQEGGRLHEVRTDDRDFQVGDHIRLREWDPVRKEYSGREIFLRISHMTSAQQIQGLFRVQQPLAVLSVISLVTEARITMLNELADRQREIDRNPGGYAETHPSEEGVVYPDPASRP